MRPLVLALAFLVTTQVAFAQFRSTENTSFRTITNVVIPADILVPTVVEIPMSENESTLKQFSVIQSGTDKQVAYYYSSRVSRTPETVVVSDLNGLVISSLSDKNASTEHDFPLVGDQRTSSIIRLKTATPVTSSYFAIVPSANVWAPDSIKVTALDTVTGPQVVSAAKNLRGGDRVSFPSTLASEWEIEIIHSQPLRLREVVLGQDNPITKRENYLRFLAEPGSSYQVYSDSDTWVSVPRPEAGNLRDDSGVVKLSSYTVLKNPDFLDSDTDKDGVIDRLDNCVNLANPDQTDINNNRIGDACDDFDRDGIININDNCPDIPNQNQMDTDGDLIGDVCDDEESRLTEKYAWLPWVGLGAALVTILIMFMMVYKRTEEEVVEAVKSGEETE